ncbi:MAG: hypothetical protein PVJ38_01610 [Candidatus Bathyarchaeota archaeon]|jgi:hypothetical protein
MDIFLRGLCEQHIANVLTEEKIHEIGELITEMGIPEGSKECFLMGYIAGTARFQLKNFCLTVLNRLPEKDEVEYFNDILRYKTTEINMTLQRRLLIDRVRNKETPPLDNFGKAEPGEGGEDHESEPHPVISEGASDPDEDKFSFQISSRKENAKSILGIPLNR